LTSSPANPGRSVSIWSFVNAISCTKKCTLGGESRPRFACTAARLAGDCHIRAVLQARRSHWHPTIGLAFPFSAVSRRAGVEKTRLGQPRAFSCSTLRRPRLMQAAARPAFLLLTGVSRTQPRGARSGGEREARIRLCAVLGEARLVWTCAVVRLRKYPAREGCYKSLCRKLARAGVLAARSRHFTTLKAVGFVAVFQSGQRLQHDDGVQLSAPCAVWPAYSFRTHTVRERRQSSERS
jgi:hypothetical protein